MSQILKLAHENQQLKRQVSQYKQVLGVSPFIDDSTLKGGYKVVKTIADRDKIDCCHRKQGMKVTVVGEDLSFKEYVLKTDNCKENIWKEINLQTGINNIELIDEKVQITEDTDFAQIGESQKDFNKKVSDYKASSDLKNQEQDNRLSDIEGENVAQKDLINGLQADLDNQIAINTNQDERIVNLEGINYIWSPTKRTLTLYDNNGNELSQVSLISLDNEGTDLRYNASTLSLELWNADNKLLDSIPVSSFVGSVGSQLQLNSNQLQLKDSQGNVLSTVTFEVNNIQGLQTVLDGKLDKGAYTGTAQDLYTRIEGKIEAGYNYIPKVGNGASGKVLVSSIISEINGKIGISLSSEAAERLGVNGNIKATQIKDQYGTLKSQRCITITGNTTLSEIHNGAVLNVTNTCNITIPTGLDSNFQCVIFAKGSIVVTFVNSGVTIYAPSGLLLKTDKMASLICTSTNNFNLTGELATS